MVTRFHDLADSPEDDRIEAIGYKTMHGTGTVMFVTDDEPGKADRYIEKLQHRFPGIRLVSRGSGPVKGTVWVKVAPPVQ